MNTRRRFERPGVAVICAVLCFGWAIRAASMEGEETDGDLAASLDRLLSRYEQYGFSGSVLVASGGEVVFEEGYGFANRGTGERNTGRTRFDFASIAKTFTGAATLALEADGRLSTDDRLETYLGPFPERKSAATIHHLATHTAGLAHRTESDLDYSADRARWIQSMKDAPFESAPGTAYRYSNAGTSLLAALVEEVSGVPFEDFVRERLFVPAGLESTLFYPEVEPGQAGVALGYADDSDKPAPSEYDGWIWGERGATGIISTVGDIHRWYQALHGGRILPAEQTAEAFDPEEEEAFGWHTATDDEGRAFIHKGGGLRAMQSQILAYPEQGVVVVWAHNDMTRNWRRALNQGLSAIALGDPYVLPPETVGHGASAPDLLGRWRTDDGTLLELVEADGGLGAGDNGFGLEPGALAATRVGGWGSFDVERVSSLELSRGPEDTLHVDLEPDGESLALVRDVSAGSTSRLLTEPTAKALSAARRAWGWLMSGDSDALWEASLHRPLRGANSIRDWSERHRFVSERLGGEKRLIDEAWALRDGSWRYWRTFEAAAGMEVVARIGLTSEGELASYGLNPRGDEPELDDRKPVAEGDESR